MVFRAEVEQYHAVIDGRVVATEMGVHTFPFPFNAIVSKAMRLLERQEYSGKTAVIVDNKFRMFGIVEGSMYTPAEWINEIPRRQVQDSA